MFAQAQLLGGQLEEPAEQPHVARSRAPTAALPATDHGRVDAGFGLSQPGRDPVKARGHVLLRPAAPEPLQPQASVRTLALQFGSHPRDFDLPTHGPQPLSATPGYTSGPAPSSPGWGGAGEAPGSDAPGTRL